MKSYSSSTPQTANYLPKAKWRFAAALASTGMIVSALSPALLAEPVHPEWWGNDVINSNIPENGKVANIGQLKNIANQARTVLENTVLDGAGYAVPFVVPNSPDEEWYDAQRKPLNP